MRHIYKTKGTHASQKRNKITAARVGRGPAGRVRVDMMAGITLRVELTWIPRWRDNPLRDWVRTFSLVPHGFKPLLSLPMAFSLCFLVRHCEAWSRCRAIPLGFGPLPMFRHGLKPAPTWLKAFGRDPLRRWSLSLCHSLASDLLSSFLNVWTVTNKRLAGAGC